ncbi:NAD(P)H-quinone oxidoreductase subunit U, chloroplastic isoform X2 [Durio zibethinus]|uniref:NAD(P)H-quinone oxidoreductase subunit U, chloroplastic isoform X2 n=1 Tax=Durio zibethinus TaxID=66656 RepID=A0A6P5XT99_DURZI|nr:NAD(P)H-quinone oxidoreductase subunit U, chloroplastic isoform X2 [Durio zibethinus]
MAVSSTTATLYISGNSLHAPTPKNGSIFLNTIRFATKQRRLSIRSSGDVSSETPATEAESEKSIDEAPKGPPSLISALNVERALRGITITDADHYGRLGLQRGCSYEQVLTQISIVPSDKTGFFFFSLSFCPIVFQVTVAYKNEVDELLNQGLDEVELSKKMDLLKESYSILSSGEERRMYDWSLARSEQPDIYAWPFEVDITQTPREDPPPEEPEDVGPTRLVGYFMLVWLILSFVLSIALAR